MFILLKCIGNVMLARKLDYLNYQNENVVELNNKESMMTKLTKITKGMLLAATLTVASMSVNANTNINATSVSPTNNYLVAALEQALSNQISMISDEISRNIDTAIEQGLTELGFEQTNLEATKQVTSNQNQLLVKKDEE